MKPYLAAAILGILPLAGCMPKPTVITMDQIRRMDYGSYPRNHEQLIKRHLAQTLIDPNSVMIDGMTRPRKFARLERTTYSSRSPVRMITGYQVCARINAKNSYGGYTGWQLHSYLIRDGQVYDNQLGIKCGSQDEIVVSVDAGRGDIEVKP